MRESLGAGAGARGASRRGPHLLRHVPHGVPAPAPPEPPAAAAPPPPPPPPPPPLQKKLLSGSEAVNISV